MTREASLLFRRLHPSKVIALGLAFLAAASVGQWYLQRHGGYSESVVDFASGLLHGVAIGTLLLGIWLQARRFRR